MHGVSLNNLHIWGLWQVGFELVGGENPYMRTAVFFQFQLNSSFMFGRTHGIMFGRTLFEYWVWKDTLHYVQKDTFQNMINKTFLKNSRLLTLKWSEYLCLVKRNRYILGSQIGSLEGG